MVEPSNATALDPMSAFCADSSRFAADAASSGVTPAVGGTAAYGCAAVMPSTPRPWPPSTASAYPRAATSSAVTGRTQDASRQAGSVIRFCAIHAL